MVQTDGDAVRVQCKEQTSKLNSLKTLLIYCLNVPFIINSIIINSNYNEFYINNVNLRQIYSAGLTFLSLLQSACTMAWSVSDQSNL